MRTEGVSDRLRDVSRTRTRAGEDRRGAIPPSDHLYEELFELAPDAYVFTSASGRILRANRAACALFNAQRAMLVGAPLSAFLPQPVVGRLMRAVPPGAARTAAQSELYTRVHRLRGAIVPVAVTVGVARDDAGRRCGYRWLVRDVSERERAEARLRASLREKDLLLRKKDLLLREVYHRVKNNLQVVCSLLSLQEPSVHDRAARAVLRGARDRLRSMALVHERLYRSADLSRVDFGEHLRELAGELRDSYGAESQVRLVFDLSPLRLGIDVAVPCSMIVHELVTNALRHAFPHGRGEIAIRLSAPSPATGRLVVADDGVGFPAHADRRGRLGLQLVTMMVDQIGARMELRRERGVEVDIAFPLGELAAAEPPP
jgi:PAS domain S-box-containing protein